MSYRSSYTGPQVSTAVKYMTHSNVGTVLTFDSSANFPAADGGDDSLKGPYFRNSKTGTLYDDNGMLIATKFLFVDALSNIMYRWRYLTQEEWLESHDNLDDYPADGYSYVPCSGAGSGDLVWEPLE